jgi:hypothetical protein
MKVYKKRGCSRLQVSAIYPNPGRLEVWNRDHSPTRNWDMKEISQTEGEYSLSKKTKNLLIHSEIEGIGMVYFMGSLLWGLIDMPGTEMPSRAGMLTHCNHIKKLNGILADNCPVSTNIPVMIYFQWFRLNFSLNVSNFDLFPSMADCPVAGAHWREIVSFTHPF